MPLDGKDDRDEAAGCRLDAASHPMAGSFVSASRAFVICATPRTGSYLLCEALEGTGRLGAPREYFDAHKEKERWWVDRLSIKDPSDYAEKVISAGCGANDVFGLKLFCDQTADLCDRFSAGGSSLPRSASFAEHLEARFSSVAYILLRRRNKVAQGVSYFRALRSLRWHARPGEAVPEAAEGEAGDAFDFDEINRCIRLIEAQDRAWRDFFHASERPYLPVYYEDMVESPSRYAAIVRSIANYITPSEVRFNIRPPTFERQADQQSMEWETRYRSVIGGGPAPGAPAVALAPNLRFGAAPRPQAKPGRTARTQSYLICTSPRSGSTLLCDALTEVGVAGRPDEFFATSWSNHQNGWRARLGVKDGESLVDALIEHTATPNGVFGAKLHWGQQDDLREALGVSAWAGPEPEKALEALIRDAFSAPRYIWLRRKDRVAQGISHYRATHTGVWRSVAGRNDQDNALDEALTYDFDRIRHFVAMADEHDWRWGDYFTSNRLTPLMIFYEDLIARPDLVLRGILKFLQIADDPPFPVRPSLEKQADARSLAWAERYARDAAERDAAEARGEANAQAEPKRARSPADAGERGRIGPRAVGAPPDEGLPLVAYCTAPHAWMELAPAPVRRAWMDMTPNRFAYRCLPMLIANQSGWMALNPEAFTVVWDGGDAPDSLRIEFEAPPQSEYARSHFGCGILTFTLPYLFRTPPGFNLHVRGPANSPKDGVSPLEGLVETDWTEATFTMNWKVTRAGHPIVFERGEAFAMLSPVRRSELEVFAPQIRPLSDEPELERGYGLWRQSRSNFNAELKIHGSDAQKAGWERDYMHGNGRASSRPSEHHTSLSLRKFLKS